MAPIKLYGMALSANVVRVAAVLNEKGLDFEIVPVDLRTGAHKHPDFLALNVTHPDALPCCCSFASFAREL
jgi:glutathione S-transferase